MLGHGAGGLVGRAFHERTFQDEESEEPDSGQKLYGELAAGECEHYRTEKRFVKKGTRSLWCSFTVSPVHDAGGEPWFAACVLEDIADRKRTEEELRRSESSLATAQRLAHIGNWEYDVKKHKTHWSGEMYRIFGLAPHEEFVPTHKMFLRFVYPDDRLLVRKVAARPYTSADKAAWTTAWFDRTARFAAPTRSTRCSGTSREGR